MLQSVITIVLGALILFSPTLLIVTLAATITGWPQKLVAVIVAIGINWLWLEPAIRVSDNGRLDNGILGWWVVAFAASYAFGWLIRWIRNLPVAPHHPSQQTNG